MNTMPKTIQEIYVAIRDSDNGFSFDGSRVCEYKGPLSFLEKLRVLKPKPIKTYILRPVGRRMATGRPRKYKADMDKTFSNFHTPSCKWFDCGRTIEFGYEYCDSHRSLCCVCNRYEPDINYNGKSMCWDCHGGSR